MKDPGKMYIAAVQDREGIYALDSFGVFSDPLTAIEAARTCMTEDQCAVAWPSDEDLPSIDRAGELRGMIRSGTIFVPMDVRKAIDEICPLSPTIDEVW